MPQPALKSPIEFLAAEIGETSRLTRELTAAAGHAIAALAETAANGPERDALHRLIVAVQAQDRVEQRLMRLEAYARALHGGASGATPDTLRSALVLDELVQSFERHHGGRRDGGDESDVELF